MIQGRDLRMSTTATAPMVRERETYDVNQREACEWVHRHLLVDGMAFDELVSAFTALVGRQPEKDAPSDRLFRRCCEIVMSSTGVPPRQHAVTRGSRA